MPVSTAPSPSAAPCGPPAGGPGGRRLPPHPVEIALAELGLGVDRPAGQTFWDDPYPSYRTLRDHAPVCWSERLSRWVVTGHTDIDQALRSGAWSANRVPSALRMRS